LSKFSEWVGKTKWIFVSCEGSGGVGVGEGLVREEQQILDGAVIQLKISMKLF
jgi:hypothetical protein